MNGLRLVIYSSKMLSCSRRRVKGPHSNSAWWNREDFQDCGPSQILSGVVAGEFATTLPAIICLPPPTPLLQCYGNSLCVSVRFPSIGKKFPHNRAFRILSFNNAAIETSLIAFEFTYRESHRCHHIIALHYCVRLSYIHETLSSFFAKSLKRV